eukprot:TRINITY_DN19035_c0_g1_i1.p2 TRINITY_DN19035_c0_g1~~TRINITY_DN19035_c0_g1_i1.p2  ORF type:complete len:138 (-),score=35.16 TRINITY_DN19035_c0_g1_i1:3-374(-)
MLKRRQTLLIDAWDFAFGAYTASIDRKLIAFTDQYMIKTTAPLGEVWAHAKVTGHTITLEHKPTKTIVGTAKIKGLFIAGNPIELTVAGVDPLFTVGIVVAMDMMRKTQLRLATGLTTMSYEQ